MYIVYALAGSDVKPIFHWVFLLALGAGNAILFALGAFQIFFSPTKLSNLKKNCFHNHQT